MSKESRHSIEQQDVILYIPFLDEQSCRRSGGNPNAGTIPVEFFNGVAIFNNTGIGFDNEISYPRTKCRFSEPEKAFSIRTRVYLTDVDGSVFAQVYDNATLQEFRFYIGTGAWPWDTGDQLMLELFDNVGTAGGANREMRGRQYSASLAATCLNRWTEFVCTYDGSGGPTPEAGICLYMDGVAVDDTNISESLGGGNYQAMEFRSSLS